MVDITRFNSFKKLIEYNNSIREEFDKVDQQVQKIVKKIVSDNSYKEELWRNTKYIEKLEKLKGLGLTGTIGYTIDSVVNDHNNYLIEEFHNTDLYELYCSLGYECEELEQVLVVFARIEANLKTLNLSEETIDVIIENIFQEYKRSLLERLQYEKSAEAYRKTAGEETYKTDLMTLGLKNMPSQNEG